MRNNFEVEIGSFKGNAAAAFFFYLKNSSMPEGTGSMSDLRRGGLLQKVQPGLCLNGGRSVVPASQAQPECIR